MISLPKAPFDILVVETSLRYTAPKGMSISVWRDARLAFAVKSDALSSNAALAGMLPGRDIDFHAGIVMLTPMGACHALSKSAPDLDRSPSWAPDSRDDSAESFAAWISKVGGNIQAGLAARGIGEPGAPWADISGPSSWTEESDEEQDKRVADFAESHCLWIARKEGDEIGQEIDAARKEAKEALAKSAAGQEPGGQEDGQGQEKKEEKREKGPSRL